jgi:hypothetical protein
VYPEQPDSASVPALALLPAYALGAADAADVELVSRLRAEGGLEARALESELLAWRSLLALLAEAPAPVLPSELTRVRLLREVSKLLRIAPAGEGSEPRANPRAWQLAAAALVLCLGGGAAAYRVADQRAAERVERLERETSALHRDLDQARGLLSDLRRALAVVGAPVVRSVDLASTSAIVPGGAPSRGGRTYVDPTSHRAVFLAHGLPALDGGTTYQLWWIAAGRPVSAGIFVVDAAGEALLAVETRELPADVQAWAVTVEPAGGVAAPTGAMVLSS